MGKKRKASEAQLNASSKDSKRPVPEPKKKGTRHVFDSDGKAVKAEPKSTLKFELRSDWHAVDLPPLSSAEATILPPHAVLDALKNHADSLLEAENALANSTVFQDSSHKFMSTIMTSGTLEDKVSALTLAVQESPLHSIKNFESLLGLAKKKSRGHALMALAAIKDFLSQGDVLPSDRKLRFFGKQPALISALQNVRAWTTGDALPSGIQEVHLLAWAYEDWLKKTYFEVLQVLEQWCNDEIPYSRTRAVTYVWELIKSKPEQEDNLLRLLVNKLGDKEKKVASKASYLLLQLEEAHPNMKEIITAAIEADILFRPGQNLTAKHYAMITLNQTVLSAREEALAKKLLEVYFAVFKALLHNDKPGKLDGNNGVNGKGGQKMNRKAIKRAKEQEEARQAEEQAREKLIAQILSGVNRAFPYAEMETSTFDAQLDTLYRITHSSNFNTGVQALILIQMITQTKQVTADRYYRTLYESLLDPRLMQSSKQIMYMNLLYKSLKADLSVKRVQAFVKRLLQILPYHEPPFICSALYLVSEVGKAFPSIATMLTDPEALDEDEDEHFVDAPEDGEEKKDAAHVNGTHNSASYDPRKRDPLHANADRSCLWELLPLQAHFHPSVSLFASKLLFAEKMPEKPDPTLHTLMHFLDRFVYRNAKTRGPGMRGVSIMQPLAGTNAADLLIKERDGAIKHTPLNTQAFWSKRVEDVPADEVFFHQYFSQANKKAKRKKSKEDDEDEELGSIGSADEDEIWKAMVDSMPEIEGDIDVDDDFSDMEDDGSDLDMGIDDEDGLGSEDGGSDVILNLESDDEMADTADAGGDEQSDDNDGFDIAELESDNDAFMDSDDDVCVDVELPMEDSTKKDKASKKKSHRQKLKDLPLYASAEDYAKLIEDGEKEL